MDIPVPFEETHKFDGSYLGVPNPPDIVYTYLGTDHKINARSGTRRKKPDGWKSPTSYSRVIYNDWGYLETSGKLVYWGYPYVQTHTWGGRFTFSNSVHRDVSATSSTLEQKALTKARLKLKDQDVNLPQAFAERALTSELVVSNCKRLAQAVRAARRLDVRRLADTLGISRRGLNRGDAFNLWLEAQYGWKPLLSDVHGAVSALSDGEARNRGRSRVCVKATAQETVVTPRIVSQSYGGGVWYGLWDEFEDHRVKVRLDYEHTPSTFATANQLGLTNPLDLAWELLPFSFVVDWFLPVGDFFSQLDASIGWTFLAGTLSDTTRVSRKNFRTTLQSYNPGQDGLSGYATISSGGRAFSTYRTVYQEEPYAVVPVPKSFSDGATAAHVANGIALLGQAFLTGSTSYR